MVFHLMDPDDAQYDEVPAGAGTGAGTGTGTGTGTRVVDRLEPATFDEIFLYLRAKEECEEWVREYREGKKVPKILLIQGKKGCGKTFFANRLIEKYGYHIMDLRARDAPGKKDKDSAMSKKDVMEVFKNSLFFRNVQEFEGTHSRPSVVFLDDIETMLQMGDNVIFNEILNVLKACKRTDLKKEKKDAPVKRRGRAKKVEAGSTEEKEYFIYNPIICTCNYTTDKKMAEFRKLCKVIDLGVPSSEDLQSYMRYASREVGITFPEVYWGEWIEYHEGDLRKIKQSFDELDRMGYSTSERLVTTDHISYYYQMFGKVDLTCQLHEGIDMVFKKELSMGDCDIIYSSDPLLVPLMVHYNILDYLQASRGGPSFSEKMDSYEEVMRSLCLYDRIHTSNYKTQGWESLPELSAVFSTYVANQEIIKYIPTIGSRFKMKFTNVLNKISQLEVNRAMVSRAYNALNRFICDEDELMYVIEIFLNLLKIQRVEGGQTSEEEEGVEEEEVESKVETKVVPLSAIKKAIAKKIDPNHTLERSEYRAMIQLMNEFHIDISSLETILKIEKLNLFENKNPKRFTARIRDELSMFVTATSYADDDT